MSLCSYNIKIFLILSDWFFGVCFVRKKDESISESSREKSPLSDLFDKEFDEDQFQSTKIKKEEKMGYVRNPWTKIYFAK